jgi:hypothetical protein
VRTPRRLSLVPLTLLAIAACTRGGKSNAAGDVDLQRDLKLASTSTLDLATPRVNPANFRDMETAPKGAPEPSKHVVKDPGPLAVASSAPELKAAPAPIVAVTQDVPQVQTVATAPVPVPNLDPIATVPRPGATSVVTDNSGGGEYGRSPDGGGIFGGMGRPGGVIIRGGGVDGDHCEPQGRRPGVYIPSFPGGAPVPTRPTGPARPRGRG